jgi:uncharacterized protein
MAVKIRFDEYKAWLVQGTLVLVEAGSRAYHTHRPDSDHDVRGCALPPLKYFFSPIGFEEAEKEPRLADLYPSLCFPKDDLDICIWNLKKFVLLAEDGNPNIIELLFTEPENLLYCHPLYKRILDIKESFLSRQLKHRFAGYATSELEKIRRHKRWLDNPPTHRPTREEFGLANIKLGKEEIHAAEKLIELQADSWMIDKTDLPESLKIQLEFDIKKLLSAATEQLLIEASFEHYREVLERAAERTLGFDANFSMFLQRYRQYRHAVNDYRSYETWLKKRNPKRAALEKKFGYDSKNAVNLVRLLRMAREMLEGKGVIIRRPDADELKAICYEGIWKYEDLLAWADKENQELDVVMEKSSLPEYADKELIRTTLVTVVEDFYRLAA